MKSLKTYFITKDIFIRTVNITVYYYISILLTQYVLGLTEG